MKKTAYMMAFAALAALAGCQTRVQIERDEPTQILPIQEVREIDGRKEVVTTGYYCPPAHYCVTARSPLYAKESVAKFAADVGDNGTWSINADGYRRDLSTNATAMVREIFSGSSQLVASIGEAYAKIAGGGAQADAVLATARRVYNAFVSAGGDADKATVTETPGGGIAVSDGSTCVTCDALGVCTSCTTTAAGGSN